MKTSKKAADESDKCSVKSNSDLSFIFSFIFIILLFSVSCKTEELPYKKATEFLGVESPASNFDKEAEHSLRDDSLKTVHQIKHVKRIEPDSLLPAQDTLIKEAVLMTFVQYSY